MRKSRLLRVAGLLLGIGLIFSVVANGNAGKPNPAEENIVVILTEDENDVQSPSYPPPGEINTTTRATTPGNSETYTETIGDAPGMDQYRWYNEDFGWTHTFDLTGKVIIKCTLEMRNWDVDNRGPDPLWEHNLIYADGHFLGELEGANAVWHVTTFEIDPTLAMDIFSDGQMYVFMNIDSTHSQYWWANTLDWSRLTIEYEEALVVIKGPRDTATEHFEEDFVAKSPGNAGGNAGGNSGNNANPKSNAGGNAPGNAGGNAKNKPTIQLRAEVKGVEADKIKKITWNKNNNKIKFVGFNPGEEVKGETVTVQGLQTGSTKVCVSVDIGEDEPLTDDHMVTVLGVKAVTPDRGCVGFDYNVTIIGKFVAPITVQIGDPNVSVEEVKLVSDTAITAKFVINVTAAGGWKDVLVTTGPMQTGCTGGDIFKVQVPSVADEVAKGVAEDGTMGLFTYQLFDQDSERIEQAGISVLESFPDLEVLAKNLYTGEIVGIGAIKGQTSHKFTFTDNKGQFSDRIGGPLDHLTKLRNDFGADLKIETTVKPHTYEVSIKEKQFLVGTFWHYVCQTVVKIGDQMSFGNCGVGWGKL